MEVRAAEHAWQARMNARMLTQQRAGASGKAHAFDHEDDLLRRSADIAEEEQATHLFKMFGHKIDKNSTG